MTLLHCLAVVQEATVYHLVSRDRYKRSGRIVPEVVLRKKSVNGLFEISLSYINYRREVFEYIYQKCFKVLAADSTISTIA